MPTILVIDDAIESHVLLEHILADHSVVLLRALNARDGLKLARAKAPDLVLLDVRMPEMDGFEVLEAMREEPHLSHVPVVFLSADTEPASKVRGFELGAVDYIAKPFDATEVVARVRRHLDASAQERRLRAFVEEAQHRQAAHETAPEAVLMGPSALANALRRKVLAGQQDDNIVFLVGPRARGAEALARMIHRRSARGTHPFVKATAGELTGPQGTLARRQRWSRGGVLFVVDSQQLGESGWRTVRSHMRQGDARWAFHVEGGSQLPSWWASAGALRINLPALSERRPDLPAIADCLVARLSQSGAALPLSESSRRRLQGYQWPGDLDELQHVLECTLASTQGRELEVDPDLLTGGPHAGHYQLLEKLAEGGMGSVHLARHRVLGQEAVVKLIHARTEGDAARRRFREEARVTAALTSQHTVRLFDFGLTDQGAIYYVMERLNGESLKQLVRRTGPLDPARVVHFLDQAAASLEEAHAAGLVHGDIKPENLFVSTAGLDRDVLKVLDFGIVRVTGSRAEMMGTPHYMAPEVLRGDTVDQRADLYALACTAHYALTGTTLFHAKSVPGVMLAHINTTPTGARSVEPSVPECIDELLLGMLSKAASDRTPATATELRRALQALPLPSRWTQQDARDAHAASADAVLGDQDSLSPTITVA